MNPPKLTHSQRLAYREEVDQMDMLIRKCRRLIAALDVASAYYACYHVADPRALAEVRSTYIALDRALQAKQIAPFVDRFSTESSEDE